MKKPWTTPTLVAFGTVEDLTGERNLNGDWPRPGCYRWGVLEGADVVKKCGIQDAGAAHNAGPVLSS